MSSRKKPVTKLMRAERRKFAEERQEAYNKLTLEQKLAKLPPEPAASKQRKRLLGLMEKPATKNVEPVDSTTEVVVEKKPKKSKKKDH